MVDNSSNLSEQCNNSLRNSIDNDGQKNKTDNRNHLSVEITNISSPIKLSLFENNQATKLSKKISDNNVTINNTDMMEELAVNNNSDNNVRNEITVNSAVSSLNQSVPNDIDIHYNDFLDILSNAGENGVDFEWTKKLDNHSAAVESLGIKTNHLNIHDININVDNAKNNNSFDRSKKMVLKLQRLKNNNDLADLIDYCSQPQPKADITNSSNKMSKDDESSSSEIFSNNFIKNKKKRNIFNSSYESTKLSQSSSSSDTKVVFHNISKTQTTPLSNQITTKITSFTKNKRKKLALSSTPEKSNNSFRKEVNLLVFH